MYSMFKVVVDGTVEYVVANTLEQAISTAKARYLYTAVTPFATEAVQLYREVLLSKELTNALR